MKTAMLKILELLPVLALAAFGGFARTVAGRKAGEKYNFYLALGEVILAVFAGLVIHYLTLEMGLSDNLRTAAIALAGYSARSILTLLKKMFIQKFEK